MSSLVPILKIRRAVSLVRLSAGSLSVLRALAGQGVSEGAAGKLVGEGRALLERGWLPHHRVCRTAECSALQPIVDSPGVCDECRVRDWYEPSEREHLLMSLARADDRGVEILAVKAGKALEAILDERCPKYAGAQAKLIPLVLGVADPVRWGRALRDSTGTQAPTVGPRWAHELSQEEIERLTPETMARLQEITEAQRVLDIEARELVARDLRGEVIEVEAEERPPSPKILEHHGE